MSNLILLERKVKIFFFDSFHHWHHIRFSRGSFFSRLICVLSSKIWRRDFFHIDEQYGECFWFRRFSCAGKRGFKSWQTEGPQTVLAPLCGRCVDIVLCGRSLHRRTAHVHTGHLQRLVRHPQTRVKSRRGGKPLFFFLSFFFFFSLFFSWKLWIVDSHNPCGRRRFRVFARSYFASAGCFACRQEHSWEILRFHDQRRLWATCDRSELWFVHAV